MVLKYWSRWLWQANEVKRSYIDAEELELPSQGAVLRSVSMLFPIKVPTPWDGLCYAHFTDEETEAWEIYWPAWVNKASGCEVSFPVLLYTEHLICPN